MLSSLRSGSDDRIRQSSLLLQQIRRLEATNNPAFEELLKIEKGMFFVALYASIEYTLTTAVSEFLAALQGSPVKPLDYYPELLPVLLSHEFNAVAESTNKRRWESKASLIQRIFSAGACEIDNAIFPAEGTNISYEHLKSIWAHLRLPGDTLPPGVSSWVVGEIKDHRNAIAHGREKASAIGARFTVTTLESRFVDVEAICAHIVMSFEEHLSRKTYLAST